MPAATYGDLLASESTTFVDGWDAITIWTAPSVMGQLLADMLYQEDYGDWDSSLDVDDYIAAILGPQFMLSTPTTGDIMLDASSESGVTSPLDVYQWLTISTDFLSGVNTCTPGRIISLLFGGDLASQTGGRIGAGYSGGDSTGMPSHEPHAGAYDYVYGASSYMDLSAHASLQNIGAYDRLTGDAGASVTMMGGERSSASQMEVVSGMLGTAFYGEAIISALQAFIKPDFLLNT